MQTFLKINKFMVKGGGGTGAARGEEGGGLHDFEAPRLKKI